MCRSILAGLIAVSSLTLLSPSPAHSAFLQQNLSSSNWNLGVPVDIGSKEFDREVSGSQQNYALNERFAWNVAINSNVAWLNPHLLNFNTESGFDNLTIGVFGSTSFSGWLGTQWWPDSFAWTPFFGPYYQIEWISDYSNTEWNGAQWDFVRTIGWDINDQTTDAPVRPLPRNTRYDGIFVSDNDVYYFSVTQPSGFRLVITLDVNAASDGEWENPPDFDLYASTTTSKPDDSNFQWRAYHGNPTGTVGGAGEVISVPSSSGDRAVYIGVHNYAGQGHFSVRANMIYPADQTLTICTQDQTPTDVMAEPGWPAAKETIQRTLVRNFQASNGNLWFSNVVLKLQSSGLQTELTQYFCEGDSTCDWCMTAHVRTTDDPGGDGCGMQASPGGRVRIPNVRCQGTGTDPYHAWWRNYDYPEYLSRELEHESGHGLGRMITHMDVGTMLADQYNASPTEDTHTVMNGPVFFPFATGPRYSTTFNHCKPWDPQPTSSPTCSQATSDWTVIYNSGLVDWWTFPNQTRSSQPWLRAQANYWLRDVITFTAQ